MSNTSMKVLQFVLIVLLGLLAFIILQFTIPGIILQAVIVELLPGELTTFLINGSVGVIVLLCLSRRRRAWLIPALILLYLVGIVPSNFALWKARDASRHDRMSRLHQLLDEYTATGKPIPDDLTSVPELGALITGPFGLDRIRYRLDIGEYIIESGKVPIGPTELYSSARNEWYYLE